MNESAGAGGPDESLPTDDGLDAAQRAAVRSPAAALLVVAGPGSGKTRVLTRRIAWRAATDSMQARRAVAVTFTRRAASELRSRLRQLEIDDMGPVGTFHSLALAQIRQYDIDHGRAERKILPNRAALSGELAEHLQRSYGSRQPITVAAALREIDWAKAGDLSVAEYRDGPATRRLGLAGGEAAADVYRHFERTKSRRRILDFDDLLAECTRLMRTDEHFAGAQRWLGRHFFVDEFQDLNRLQWNLLWAWLGGAESVRNHDADICAVGDADQAIYGWNGADSSYLTGFDRHFADAQIVRLDLNYRSQPSLVAAATAVMSDVADSAPASTSGHAQAPARPHEIPLAPTAAAFDDAGAEAVGIARWLADRHVGRTRWDSFGVLARTNAQLSDIGTALDAHGIPYRLGGQRSPFLELPAVREMLEHLRDSGASFPSTVDDLRAEALDGPPDTVSDPMLMRVLDLADAYLAEWDRSSGARSRRIGPSGEGFATWVGLFAGNNRELSADLFDSDRSGTPFDPRDGAVTLATFHAAKGLQWRHVVVAGTEDGLVPLRPDDAEERRLFYVAVSRASHTLHFTWARHRSDRHRTGGSRNPSPWLSVIEHATAEAAPLSPDDAASRVAAARAALDATRPS
ncbi:ATP-dependent helicase [Candidatus Poriferisodalis sp.]|uniref:ATP-dependent helicase n=1 Tax=Candidatus Poriferisodalis sp. TaxID=3101277 RepID=UPI003B018059